MATATLRDMTCTVRSKKFPTGPCGTATDNLHEWHVADDGALRCQRCRVQFPTWAASEIFVMRSAVQDMATRLYGSKDDYVKKVTSVQTQVMSAFAPVVQEKG